MTSISDILTSLSETGRAEVDDKLRKLGIPPDHAVAGGQVKSDSVFDFRKTSIEEIEAEEGAFDCLILKV